MPTPPPPASLSPSDLARFGALVRETSGLDIREFRWPDLERVVLQALRATGAQDTKALYTLLADKHERPDALDVFIEALTVGETHFFRHRAQFEALEQKVLPELIERRRGSRKLRIWSAGCASGEEPYSLAILLDRLLPDRQAWDIWILATDISNDALRKARRASYSEWSFREVRPDIREQYFAHHGHRLELDPEIRGRVAFAYMNLIDDVYPSPATGTEEMDLILCRNVLIYFSEDTIRDVVGRFYRAIADDGWLVVSHAEPSPAAFHPFAAQPFPGTAFYRKASFVDDGDSPGRTSQSRQAAKGPLISPNGGRRSRHLVSPNGHPRGVKRTPSEARRADRGGSAARPSLDRPPRPASVRADAEEPTPVQAAEPGTDGPTEEELRRLQRTALANPMDVWSAYLEAKALADSRDLDAAEEWVEIALKRDPFHAPTRYLQGTILSERDRTDEALAALRRCVYTDPTFIMGHFGLAGLYERVGLSHRAQKAIENVLALASDQPRDDLVPEGDGLTVGQLLDMVDWRNRAGAGRKEAS
jgi:chemotaxis protein methyltransferase CheR